MSFLLFPQEKFKVAVIKPLTDMMLKFQFWGQLREAAATQTAELEVSKGTTLESALQALTQEYPALQPKLLNEDGSVRISILLFQNEQQLSTDALLQAVEQDASFTLMSPIAGG